MPRLPRAYLWPGLVLVAQVYPWVVAPGRTAAATTLFALAGILAGAIAHAGDQDTQRALLEEYETELDDADHMARLVGAVIEAKRRSPAESQAIRALRSDLIVRRVVAVRRLRDADIAANRPVRALADYLEEVAA